MALNMEMAARVGDHRKLFRLLRKDQNPRNGQSESIRGKNGNSVEISEDLLRWSDLNLNLRRITQYSRYTGNSKWLYQIKKFRSTYQSELLIRLKDFNSFITSGTADKYWPNLNPGTGPRIHYMTTTLRVSEDASYRQFCRQER